MLTDPSAAPKPAALPPELRFPIVFKLKDREGTEHTYEAFPHPATEGEKVMWTLVALGAEPLARLVGGVIAVSDGADTLGQILELDREKVMSDVDWGSVGGDIKTSVLSMNMPALRQSLFSYVQRDGEPLNNKQAFDRAYTRNYWELGLALWMMVRENHFIPPLPTSESKDSGEESPETDGPDA